MEKELFIDGKRYISSKRAAKLTGYTHDYIGQLSRADKIPGKLVGRTKFVDEEALVQYKQESDATKKQTAQERSKKFKSGRKVPIVHGNTTKVTSAYVDQKKSTAEQKKKSEVLLPDFREEVDMPFVQKQRQVNQAAHVPLGTENETSTSVSKQHTSVPSLSDVTTHSRTWTKAPIVAAVFFFALAGSVFVSLFVVPSSSKELSEVRGGAQAYNAWVVSGVESITHVLLKSPFRAGVEEFSPIEMSGRYANDIFVSDEVDNATRPQKESESIIASIRAKGKETFENAPTFTLASAMGDEITERTKYAQFEVAYVGAVMEYRFLEIGLDVKTLAKNTLAFARTMTATVTSFVRTQLLDNDNLLAATGSGTFDIFERSATSVFRNVESLKDILSSLFSANVGTFTAPNGENSYEGDSFSSENATEIPDPVASSNKEQKRDSYTQKASTTSDRGDDIFSEEQNATSTIENN